MAEKLISRIPDDARGELVDLGCGTGWPLAQIANLSRFNLTALDIASSMIDVAKSRIPNATFICRDLEETGLPDNHADVVFSNAAIQWCDTFAAIKEIKRISKTTGLVLCSTFGPQTLCEVKSAWQESGDQFNRVHPFESGEKLRSAMAELGLKNVRVDSELQILKFNSVRDLLHSIKRLGATNASANRPTGLLGTNQYRKFCSVLEERLAREGDLKLTFECIFASATA